MSRGYTAILSVMIVGLCLCIGATLNAQDPGNDNSPADGERDQTWYRQPTKYQSDTRAIVQQRAQVRAAQRDARLASMNWYGMYNSRPTAAPTPFTSMYSPVWQQPGGRPFAWNTASWPTSVVYVR